MDHQISEDEESVSVLHPALLLHRPIENRGDHHMYSLWFVRSSSNTRQSSELPQRNRSIFPFLFSYYFSLCFALILLGYFTFCAAVFSNRRPSGSTPLFKTRKTGASLGKIKFVLINFFVTTFVKITQVPQKSKGESPGKFDRI
jgi:hypothetical protein